MDLIKVKGIVIREVQYKDNDKIITILTDKLGKIVANAKGAKKTNSPILANCQYLVFSEFVLYKNKNFYYINSASVIDTFYNLKIDLDKLQMIFELTKLLQGVTDENEDTTNILKLFLNTLYIIDKLNKDNDLIIATFKIKLFCLLGFTPRIEKCAECGQAFNDLINDDKIYYDYVRNVFCCTSCTDGKDKRRYIKISKVTLIAIEYIMKADIKKVFSFELKNVADLKLFAQVYTDAMSNGI